jgi:4-hydroxy-tetrahydrodipicolinate synthase
VNPPFPPAGKVPQDSPRLGGVVAAAITPCSRPGDIDHEAAARLYKHLAANGCDGLFVVSSTGEATVLGDDERRALIATACEAAGDRATIFAGVSTTGVRQTLRQTAAAAAEGADVAVAMSPHFLRYDQREIAGFLTAIADQASLPLAIYHHPRRTNALEVETIARLASHPNIVALKDTSGTSARLKQLMSQLKGQDLAVFEGSEPLSLEALQLGASGMVTAVAGVAPEVHAALMQAVSAGEMEEAQRRQRQIEQLWQMFALPSAGDSITNFSLTLKLALRRRGWLSHLDGMLAAYQAGGELERRVLAHLDEIGFGPEGFEHDADVDEQVQVA